MSGAVGQDVPGERDVAAGRKGVPEPGGDAALASEGFLGRAQGFHRSLLGIAARGNVAQELSPGADGITPGWQGPASVPQ